jgi:hypothetical protein
MVFGSPTRSALVDGAVRLHNSGDLDAGGFDRLKGNGRGDCGRDGGREEDALALAVTSRPVIPSTSESEQASESEQKQT